MRLKKHPQLPQGVIFRWKKLLPQPARIVAVGIKRMCCKAMKSQHKNIASARQIETAGPSVTNFNHRAAKLQSNCILRAGAKKAAPETDAALRNNFATLDILVGFKQSP